MANKPTPVNNSPNINQPIGINDSASPKAIEEAQAAIFNPLRYLPAPQYSASTPEAYAGTCDALIHEIRDTVNQTIDSMDYSGLNPYVKIADQMAQGKTFEETTLSSKDEAPATACVGMSHALLKALKVKHGIEGDLAILREGCSGPFEHGGVIVECEDGRVLIEGYPLPAYRLYPVLFNSTLYFEPAGKDSGHALVGSKRGANPPLTILFRATETAKATSYEYHLSIANGDDIVMKNYLFRDCHTPVVVFKKGKPFKLIKVYLDRSQVVLEDRSDKNHVVKETISFASIREEGLPRLKTFMTGPDGKSDFHIPVEQLHNQICTLVAQETQIQKLFNQVHFRFSPHKESEEPPKVLDEPEIASPPLTLPIVNAHLSPSIRKKVVENLATGLAHLYIDEEQGCAMAELLRYYLELGKYDRYTSPWAFRNDLLQDLRSICPDKHLDIVFSPEPIANDDPDYALDRNPENFTPKQKALIKQWDQENLSELSQINFGIEKPKIIGTNIGYLKINKFPPPYPETYACIDEAMRPLANAQGLIIDLRENTGGYPETVARVASYLFNEKALINQLYQRSTQEMIDFYADPNNLGPTFGGKKPICILVGEETFSGGEELAYDLQAAQRATLIGQKTKGGAHPVRNLALDDHFYVSIPYQKARNPKTETNWETTGVIPDHLLSENQDSLEFALKLLDEDPK